MHNVLNLSLRPFVCLSVRSFVPLLSTCEHYTLKTNEPISMQIGKIFPVGKDMNGFPSWSEGHRQDTGGRSYVWKPGGDIILDPFSRVDRGIQ